jgi:hypothetical protein
VARNLSAHAENKIHDDVVARQYGFGGGLVPGVTVYGYATHPLVVALGRAWLERGRAALRLIKPVLDGEEVHVSGSVETSASGTVEVSVSVRNGRGEECATVTAAVPPSAVAPGDTAVYARAPLPAQRPPASRELLAPGRTLGSPEAVYDLSRCREFLEGLGESLDLYRGMEGLVHPAFYLDQANRALDQNVRMGPWIHISSAIQHLSAARVGERMETRGRVAALQERKGRELVELDLLILAGVSLRPVARVTHMAIWRLPAPASA